MKNNKHESEDNKQESNPVPQQTEKQANPFGNLKPAEIPTRLHTFSYQGGEKEKDYYKQLDGWVRMFEQCGYCPVKIEVVTDKIVWCWKWKKITEQQKNELCDRMVEVLKYML